MGQQTNGAHIAELLVWLFGSLDARAVGGVEPASGSTFEDPDRGWKIPPDDFILTTQAQVGVDGEFILDFSTSFSFV